MKIRQRDHAGGHLYQQQKYDTLKMLSQCKCASQWVSARSLNDYAGCKALLLSTMVMMACGPVGGSEAMIACLCNDGPSGLRCVWHSLGTRQYCYPVHT